MDILVPRCAFFGAQVLTICAANIQPDHPKDMETMYESVEEHMFALVQACMKTCLRDF